MSNYTISLEEDTGRVEAIVFPSEYEQTGARVGFDPYLLDGYLAGEVGADALTAYWLIEKTGAYDTEGVLHFLKTLREMCENSPGSTVKVTYEEGDE